MVKETGQKLTSTFQMDMSRARRDFPRPEKKAPENDRKDGSKNSAH